MLHYAHHERDLDPAEVLFAAVVKRAIRDARQETNERLREEAMRWLWSVAPGVARKADLPIQKSHQNSGSSS